MRRPPKGFMSLITASARGGGPAARGQAVRMGCRSPSSVGQALRRSGGQSETPAPRVSSPRPLSLAGSLPLTPHGRCRRENAQLFCLLQLPHVTCAVQRVSAAHAPGVALTQLAQALHDPSYLGGRGRRCHQRTPEPLGWSAAQAAEQPWRGGTPLPPPRPLCHAALSAARAAACSQQRAASAPWARSGGASEAEPPPRPRPAADAAPVVCLGPDVVRSLCVPPSSPAVRKPLLCAASQPPAALPLQAAAVRPRTECCGRKSLTRASAPARACLASMAATRDEQSSGALFCARCGTLMDVEVAKHAVVCGMCGAARSFSGATPGLRHAAAQQR